MADFTIRVVLHDNATWQDYTNLASNMAARGMVDVIIADDGRRYKLPPAEYTYSGNATINQVRSSAVDAAAKTGKRNAVLVTQATGRSWNGLEEVR
ncbi:hypothetical protein [Variovorax paradoxus]|jgi:hypothetical protein|uniref:hypothetical protein n=1 Tax=Variovorax paradoxus TaxID=34073 RepID=UPI00339A54E4